MKKLIIILALAMLFIAGCGDKQAEDTDSPVEPVDDMAVCAQDVQECPDGTYVSRNPDNNCKFDECPLTANQETLQDIAPEVSDLIEKAKTIDNYEYLDGEAGYVVLVKGDKQVIMSSDDFKVTDNKIRANSIFIDHSAKTAYAACAPEQDERNTFECFDEQGTYTEIDYGAVTVEDPLEEVKSLTNGKLVGSMSCENRQCDIIEYTKNGKAYKMYVRKTYILPYKIAELDDNGKEANYKLYTNAAFDHLDDDEVEIDNDWELIE